MILLELFRNKLFWTIDFLKGGVISKLYNEVKFINENYNSIKVYKLRDENLNNLLNHATSTTPFYKAYSQNLQLSDFPVISKNIIRNNYDDFKSTVYLGKKNYRVGTSGSTGTPFILYQNAEKRNRHNADTLYFTKATGYRLGEKLVYLRVWTNQNKMNNILAWMKNIYMQDISNLNDKVLSDFIDMLKKDENTKCILAYSSTLEALCRYLDKINSKPLNCNIKSIIAIAEGLNLYTKESLIKYFKTTVVSRYSNNENGILSQQPIENENEFNINWASYTVEILKFDEDIEAAPGELGRIIITDLFNYCMPIIRYDTGDVGCIEKNKSGLPVLSKLEGRKQDMVYNTKEELISSFIIGSLLKKYPSLIQFQFIQESKKGYTIKINNNGEFKNENQLIKEFKEVIGSDSIINVEYVNEIPVLDSGKRRQVINKYLK